MAVYYFEGKESFTKKQELNKHLEGIGIPEMNVCKFYEYDPVIIEFMLSVPFFADKKIGILYFFPEEEAFNNAVKELPDSTDIYILTQEIPDQRKKLVKELISLVERKSFDKIDEQLLFKCISSRLQRLGYPAEEIKAVKDILMESYSGYFRHENIDLEVVQMHVHMLAFSGSLSPENIRTFSPDSLDYRAFRLTNMLLEKNEKCIEFARTLLEQGEQAISLISLIAYQIRICYKASLFSKENYLNLIGIRRYQLFEDFALYDTQKYVNIYKILMESIRKVKKGENAGAVMTICLAESLAILKEEF